MIERVARTLRGEAVAFAPDFDARVMQRIREESRAIVGPGLWAWMTRSRTIRVSPLAGLALAAGVAGVVALAARDGDSTAPATVAYPAATSVAAPEQMMKFVVVNDSASTVAILGDFNDWEEGGMPLRRVREKAGVWEITIPLAPGRYHYTFVVDGKNWIADPLAPRTLEDDFGRPNSVITVGDART